MKRLDLGASDAESDPRLGEYFVTTPYVEEAISGRKTLFIGRKGSGKSALFRQFPALLTTARPDLSTVSMTPDQYLWNALRSYREQHLSNVAAHRNAWKLTLAVQIASKLCSLNYVPHGDAEEAAQVLRKFLSDNFDDPVLPSGGAVKVLRELRSLNLSAFGFGAGFNRGDEAQQELTPGVIAKLLELIETCTREAGVVVLIDRVDEEWDGSNEAETLVIALLMVAKELNDSLRPGEDRAGLKVLVFLRSDIYAILGSRDAGPQFDDKDKHRGTEQALTWTVPELREMLTRRLPDATEAYDLFEQGSMRGESSAFSYIVTRTFLRPREVIQFVEECQRRAPADAEEITKDTVREAEDRYSRWKVEDLRTEFARVHPELRDLLEALQQGHQRYKSLDELEERIAAAKPGLVDTRDPRRLLEILFETSVIGVRPRDSGKVKYRSEDSDLPLPHEAAVYVHQSLRKGLGIIERRERVQKTGAIADALFEDEDEAEVEIH